MVASHNAGDRIGSLETMFVCTVVLAPHLVRGSSVARGCRPVTCSTATTPQATLLRASSNTHHIPILQYYRP